MKRMHRCLSLLLALAFALALAGCGGQPQEEESEVSTLRVGISGRGFSGIFSPFFAETAADQTAMELTQLRLLTSDRAGLPVLQGIEGETRPYNGADYTYYGPADLTMTENADGTVFYDITLREDLAFSDGEPVTIDDLIFSLYVLCDPAYNGPNRLREMPIQGVKDYRLNNISLSALLARLGEDNTDFSQVTQEQQTAFWAAVDDVLTPLVQNLVDQQQAIADANLDEEEEETERIIYTPALVAQSYGWGALPEDATARDAALAMGEYFNWDFIQMADWFSSSYFPVTDLAERLGEVYGYASETVTSGENATEISGIQKTGDYSLRVVADQLDVRTLYYLGSVYIAPLHYYGDAGSFDEAQGSFGFEKGELEGIRALNGQPLGAGAYQLVSNQNGTLTYEANEHYYLGAPKTQQLQLEGQDAAQRLEAGKLDFCCLDSGYSYRTEDENLVPIPVATLESTTYHYIGLNPQTVSVAGDAGSEASRSLRTGIATVLAACRQPALEELLALAGDVDYGGHNTAVIDYPASSRCWLIPGREDPAYEEAYSRDRDGQAIYTEDMTQEERLECARQAALDYFAAAGYTVEHGVLTAPPEGASLSYEAKVWSDPASVDLTLLTLQMASEQLAQLGMELTVTNTAEDPEQPYPEPGQSDLWAGSWDGTDMAGVQKDGDQWEEWYLVADPEAFLSPVFYCGTDNGGAGAGSRSGVFRLNDPELDQWLTQARSTVDQAWRQALYQQCAERIMDWACEVPSYQDHGNLIYHTQRLNADTLPPDMTAYYGWLQSVHTLEAPTEENNR